MTKPDEFWVCLGRCMLRIARAGQPVTLYLSTAGFPTSIAGVGGISIGVYTTSVSIQMLLDDIHEADRERRRG